MDFTIGSSDQMETDECAQANVTNNCSILLSNTITVALEQDEPSYINPLFDPNNVTQINNTNCLDETSYEMKKYIQSNNTEAENRPVQISTKNFYSASCFDEGIDELKQIETPYADQSRINENFNDFTPRSAMHNYTSQFSTLSNKSIGNLTAPNDFPNETINTTLVNESIQNSAIVSTLPRPKNPHKDFSLASATNTPKIQLASSILANARSVLTPNTSMSGRFSNNILKEIESMDIEQIKSYSLNVFGIDLEKINWTEATDNLKHELNRVKEEKKLLAENVRIAKKSLEEITLNLEKKKKSTVELKEKLNETNGQIEKVLSKVAQNKNQLDFFTMKDSDLERAQNGKLNFVFLIVTLNSMKFPNFRIQEFD